MNEVEADLALLALPPPPRPPIKTGSDLELVWLFLRDNAIERGKCRSVETCTLHRMYLEWQRREFPGIPPAGPYSFAKQAKRLGLRKREDRYKRAFYLVRRAAAERLLSWERNHPEPDGYRDAFRTHFGHRRKPLAA